MEIGMRARWHRPYLAIALCGLCWAGGVAPGLADTPEEWVELGQRVHGGFGSYIALGVRIGLQPLPGIQPNPRELAVTYYSGAIAPCPCVVDGIMIATVATPGQGSLQVADRPSPPDTFGVAEIRHRSTGATVRYIIPASAKPLLDEWNATLNAAGRYNAVMGEPAERLFIVE